MFSDSEIHDTITKAIAAGVVPEGKTRALVAKLSHNGVDGFDVEATFAEKVGEHWQVGLAADWHGGADVGLQAQAVASW